MDGGVHDRHAFFMLHLGKFDDEDGIFGGQSDQHDDANLSVNIVVKAAHQQADVGAQYHQRRGQKHAEGQRPTLVLRGQKQEDENEGLDEHSKKVLKKVIGYMEKKYISGPMKLAKEIILKNAN